MNPRLWIPLLSGFGMSTICPVSGGERFLQTPPKSMFPIIWSILYILLGVSWTRASKKRLSDIMHAFLVLLLISWIVMYSCNRKKLQGLYILACIFSVTVGCMSVHDDDLSRIMLTPLLAWILIAFNLNYNIVNIVGS